MDTIQTQCPMCHSMFNVPSKYVNRRAICKKCGKEFRIKSPNLDDTVMGWLDKEHSNGMSEEEIADALGKVDPAVDGSAAVSAAAAKIVAAPATRSQAESTRTTRDTRDTARPTRNTTRYTRPTPRDNTQKTPGPGDSMVIEVDMEEMLEAPKPTDCLKLSHTDELGAFVIFPTMLLYNEEFRASFPRCCLGCGSTRSLRIHTVYWQSVRNDRRKEAKDSSPVKSSIKADGYLKLSDSKLLAALPKVPNKPKPFNLPMPYFICERCSPVGAIMTHVRHTASGREVCEIGINSLARAAQFLARNLGREHEAFKSLEKELVGGKDDPWKALPLSVRNRIERWFKLEKGESFHAYILDHDFAKAEGGLGGLVITDKRLVYHKFAGHREFDLAHQLSLKVVDKTGLYQLHISDDQNKPAVLHCDHIVFEKVKQVLVTLGAKHKIAK